ncbi:MAG: hypothetical protein AAGG51_22435 [Cyanobacteria bacterium P01_G01_bin.54]
MMTSSLALIPASIAQTFAKAIAEQTVTEADRYRLMAALLDLDRDLDAAERQAVDDILHRLRSGQHSNPMQGSQVRRFWARGSYG